MKLRSLLRHLPKAQVRGPRNVTITGLANDSRLVAPGNLFIARRGGTHDAARFIPEALQSGAVAVACDLFDASLTQVTQVIHPDIRELEACFAARYYNDPSRSLFVVGVTGTNGKTSTTLLIQHLLTGLGALTGLVGTVETVVGKHRMPAIRTTPDVLTNHRLLFEMKRSGCQAAVMEVTSHGLDQRRTANIAFDVGVLTNISQDHLDYHKTMDAYVAAKARLFQQCPVAVINVDDPHASRMACEQIIRYGLSQSADLRISDVSLSTSGAAFTLSLKGQSVAFRTPLLGLFNVYNATAAVAALLPYGASLHDMAPLLASAAAARGRMEPVPNDQGVHVVVDYAHTPDALSKALQALKPFKEGRLIVVFGCGGERDQSKRKLMGAIASQEADYAIVTSDNPRSEDPTSICEAICEGMSDNFEMIIDRKTAIYRALALATKGDIVCIAGKGHETYQVFDRRRIPFDDREAASSFFNNNP